MDSRLITGRFVEPVPMGLVCSICENVLDAPTLLSCGHTFCRHCIETRFSQGQRMCFICQTVIQSELLAPNYPVIPVIDELKIWCVFQSKGCRHTPTVKMLKQHEQNCDFGPGICLYEGCPNNTNGTNNNLLCHTLLRRDQNQHRATCEWRLVECPNKCTQADYDSLTTTTTTTTPTTPTTTQNQTSRVRVKDLSQHKRQCARQLIPCSLECGQSVERRNSKTHQQFECTKQTIHCEAEGCNACAIRGDHETWKHHWGVSSLPANTADQLLGAMQYHASCNRANANLLQQRISTLEQTNQAQQQRIDELQLTVKSLEYSNRQNVQNMEAMQRTMRAVFVFPERLPSLFRFGGLPPFRNGHLFRCENSTIKWSPNDHVTDHSNSSPWDPFEHSNQVDQITTVDLTGSQMESGDIRILCQHLIYFPALTALRLGKTLDSTGACDIFAILPALFNLVRLDLDVNNLTAKEGGVLARALPSLQSLRHLYLNNNQLGDEGVEGLVGAVQQINSLQLLVLRNNGVSAEMKTNLQQKLSFVTALIL